MSDKSGPNPLFDAEPGFRRVRSFVLREGRLTPAQQRALDELWPRYGLANSQDQLDLARVFGRDADCIMEIGFGDGEALAFAARRNPEHNFIGVEVHRPGVGALLQELEAHDIQNVRIICADAVQVLTQRLPEACLAGVRLYFPDPWPKKRHHKRRIVNAGWLEQVGRVLKPGGILHMATDWEPYAQHMLEAADAHEGLTNVAGAGRYSPCPDWRPQTKFERRGERLGHGVWDLLYERQPA